MVAEKLKLEFKNIGYKEDARLQIKSSLYFGNTKFKRYYKVSPIIYFDLRNDEKKLKEKFGKDYSIFLAREIEPQMMIECEQYFRILGMYATGMLNSLDELMTDTIENAIKIF